jgi:hypothetical protein
MAETNGWSPEDVTTLSHTSVDRYYEIFKNTKPAKSALARIGKESAINARRVKKYGVEVEAE